MTEGLHRDPAPVVSPSTEDVRAPVHNGEGVRRLRVPGGSDGWREPPLLLTITVTAEDIANGDPGCPWDCPIAIALDRAYPGPWDVTGTNAYRRDYPDLLWALGERSRGFVRMFDSLAHQQAKPFTEELHGVRINPWT